MTNPRARPRRLCSKLLICVHVHSFILFVVFLSVASKDLPSIKTTKDPEINTTIDTPTSSPSTSTIRNIATTVNSTQITSTSTVATVAAVHVDDSPTRWRDFDVLSATQSELCEYKLFLEGTLVNVSRMLEGEDYKSKRFLPLPSSLPDYNSSFVINQQNASVDESEVVKLKVELVEKSTDTIAETSTQLLAEITASNESTTVDYPSEHSESPNNSSAATLIPETEAEDLKKEANESGSSTPARAFGVQTSRLDENTQRRSPAFEPTVGRLSSFDAAPLFQQNHTIEECKRLTQAELVNELKQKGTFNPDLMAWDVSGVFRFLDRSIVDQYERQVKSQKSNKQAVQRNVEALERILAELNLRCDVRAPEVLSRLGNLTLPEPRRTVISPSLRMSDAEVRFKRHVMADDLLRSFESSRRRDETPGAPKRQKSIGDVHVVPFGCDKRGEEEDGYLRLCGACQAIRKLPETFFPPFINEVMCDEDKACLYFYDYPHGKCKQKHMNFVVLRNVGTHQCQVWQKFNLNVRVSCECFVDEMSFFSKYV